MSNKTKKNKNKNKKKATPKTSKLVRDKEFNAAKPHDFDSLELTFFDFGEGENDTEVKANDIKSDKLNTVKTSEIINNEVIADEIKLNDIKKENEMVVDDKVDEIKADVSKSVDEIKPYVDNEETNTDNDEANNINVDDKKNIEQIDIKHNDDIKPDEDIFKDFKSDKEKFDETNTDIKKSKESKKEEKIFNAVKTEEVKVEIKNVEPKKADDTKPNSTSSEQSKVENEHDKEAKITDNEDKVITKTRRNRNISTIDINLTKCITILVFLIIFLLGIYVAVKMFNSFNDIMSFHSISLKPYKNISDKDEALYDAFKDIEDASNNNEMLSPTNLTLAKRYDKVVDDEDRNFYKTNAPIPILSDEEKEPEDTTGKSSAFQIFEKLQQRYKVLNQELYNLCDMNPVNIVRQYGYSGYSIIGKYNPENKTHVYGKRHTWFIPHFQNVNIRYYNGDGDKIIEDNNIKDIMSMASIYTYYKDPYDTKTFLNYCYYLFDNSYSYVASISEVYYCSGCMHYDDPAVASLSTTYNINLDKIKDNHEVQNVLPKDIPYKAGNLSRHDVESHVVDDKKYESYARDIKDGINTSKNNYCPGHVDLNIDVKVMTLDARYGLPSIDKIYGNKGLNYTKNWHGWDAYKINEARQLSYKDWDELYGISISYIDFVKPLTQEEINYYLNRLSPDISANRRTVVETALRSIGRIPYYYGGKTSRFGYETNAFGTKIPADYKGRCLKGLDCSGWINWVYMTAFNKFIIKSEGTSKLAFEGTRIKRDELLPGDIIVRPGIDSHVMMFLEWAEDGKVKVIHENGSVNNVSIATFDAYYPYYRRLINS